MLKDYLAAALCEWKVLLVGGAIAAAAAIYSFTGPHPMPRAWGWTILVVTFVTASYRAWKAARMEVDGLKADIAERERRTMTITSVSSGIAGSTHFALYVHLVNPGKQPVSFQQRWLLDVTMADGTVVRGIEGSMKGEIRTLQQHEQFNVQIVFPYSNRFGFYDAIQRPTVYALSVLDLEGRPLVAHHSSG